MSKCSGWNTLPSIKMCLQNSWIFLRCIEGVFHRYQFDLSAFYRTPFVDIFLVIWKKQPITANHNTVNDRHPTENHPCVSWWIKYIFALVLAVSTNPTLWKYYLSLYISLPTPMHVTLCCKSPQQYSLHVHY